LAATEGFFFESHHVGQETEDEGAMMAPSTNLSVEFFLMDETCDAGAEC
jgi:hypothetical protein